MTDDPFQNNPHVRRIEPEETADEDELEVIEESIPFLFYTIVFLVVCSGTLGLLFMFKDLFNPF